MYEKKLNLNIQFFNNINDCTDDINDILAESEVYDSYAFDGFPVYIAYAGNIPAGFLSYIVSEYKITPEAVIDDSDITFPTATDPQSNTLKKDAHEAETRVLVSPKYRGRGVCKALLNFFYADLETSDIERVVYALPPALLSSSLAAFPAYAELLFTLEQRYFTPKETDPIESAIKNSQPFLKNCTLSTAPTEDKKLFKVLINNKCVGSLSTDYGETRCFMHNVYISPKLRGLKVGTYLLNAAMTEHFKNNSIPVIVNTRSSNMAAVGLYESMGFIETDRIWYYRYSG